MPTPTPLPTRGEILEEFRNAKHTATSRAVLDCIERREIRVAFRRRLKTLGTAHGTSISIRRMLDFGQMLATLVHEGRHCLDVRDGLIPAGNPGGPLCLLAEMLAWKAAGRFAKLNGYVSASAFQFAEMGPKELAILLHWRYRGAIKRELDDFEIRRVMRRFRKRDHEV